MSDYLNDYNNAKVLINSGKLQSIKSAPVIALDTETTSLDFYAKSNLFVDDKVIECNYPVPFGISFAYRNTRGRVVMGWARHTSPLYADVLELMKSKTSKTWHNARYDLRVLQFNNLLVNGYQHDTLTMARIYWNRRQAFGLDDLAKFLCPAICDWENSIKKSLTKLKTAHTRKGYPKDYVNYSMIPDEVISQYAVTDAFVGLTLWERLYPEVMQIYPDVYKREMKILHIVKEIENTGISFDYIKARRETGRLSRKQKAALAEIQKIAGPEYNPNSPAQTLKVLKSLGVTNAQLRVKGKITTEAEKLRELLEITKQDTKLHTFLDNYLVYKAYAKTLSTYLKPMSLEASRNNGIIHCQINPTNTRTGRMSSSNPNLQNIPNIQPGRGRVSGGANPVRSCFTVRPGNAIYYFDYANMEMAVFGLYAQDEFILETYCNGGDVHGAMAEKLYGPEYTKEQRNRTKDTNFGVLYGMGVGGMAKARGVSINEAKDFLNMYYNTFPSIRVFLEKCKYEIQAKGYIEDYFGRHYDIPYQQAYKAVNAVIQGSCAQAFKVAAIALDKVLNDGEKILLMIHDEFQIERNVCIPKVEQLFCKKVLTTMTDIPEFTKKDLLLRVDVKRTLTNWEEKETIEI